MRSQWSKDLKVEPHTAASRVASMGTSTQQSGHAQQLHHTIHQAETSHFENYRYNYRSNIIGFGEVVLGDIRNIPTQKLRLRNQHKMPRGIWIGRDLIANYHIPHHLGTTMNIPFYNNRSTTSAGRSHSCTVVKNNDDLNFLKDIYWLTAQR